MHIVLEHSVYKKRETEIERLKTHGQLRKKVKRKFEMNLKPKDVGRKTKKH
jgi:hypothetical protein